MLIALRNSLELKGVRGFCNYEPSHLAHTPLLAHGKMRGPCNKRSLPHTVNYSSEQEGCSRDSSLSRVFLALPFSWGSFKRTLLVSLLYYFHPPRLMSPFEKSTRGSFSRRHYSEEFIAIFVRHLVVCARFRAALAIIL